VSRRAGPSVDDPFADWARPAGIFVLAPIAGAAAAVIQDLQARYDAKLAGAFRPHITLAGSSGVGPIRGDTPIGAIGDALGPIARSTPPLTLAFLRPQRFMQTDIISLPLDPHGPIRLLHDRIAQSGLAFGPARFTFTPHVTLNFYRTLSVEDRRALLAVTVSEPAVLDRLVLSVTDDAHQPHIALELALGGNPAVPSGRQRDHGRAGRGE
jgi:2'-5' RNA ligase